jgi:hypothetical protein
VVALAHRERPDDVAGYYQIEPTPPDAPIRSRFTLPFVSMVGSHEGCGCGFNSDDLESQGFHTLGEALELLDAMHLGEREEFDAELASRQRLGDLVADSCRFGRVEVFGSWSGGEGDAAIDVRLFECRSRPQLPWIREGFQ